MPIYEFACSQCGTVFELMRKIGDRTEVACVQCASTQTQQQISLTAFQLRGSGWAHDGYATHAESQANVKTVDQGKTSADAS
jgi:putative FmdB family regulatory protein